MFLIRNEINFVQHVSYIALEQFIRLVIITISHQLSGSFDSGFTIFTVAAKEAFRKYLSNSFAQV